jgi:phosphoribosylformylglycinamidine cyclo-ligase
VGNVPRGLGGHHDAVIDSSTWEAPRIFGEIQSLGNIDDAEMARVFNLGIGMTVIVPAEDAHKTLDVLRTAGHRAVEIGDVERGDGSVRLV